MSCGFRYYSNASVLDNYTCFLSLVGKIPAFQAEVTGSFPVGSSKSYKKEQRVCNVRVVN